MHKPVPRSALRLHLGRLFFIVRRYVQWHIGEVHFASRRSSSLLPYELYSHQSVIMRPLKKVDMYLQENKKNNLQLAISRINGMLVPPGATFSFWKTVGMPTQAKGYLDGLELSSGGLRVGTGGGLCQLSNLIYWMTLHTQLQVTERWRHSFDVFPDVDRTQPFGSGATVAYNYIDLQLYNPTSNTFQLRLWIDATHLHGAWLCSEQSPYTYQVIEKNHHMQPQPWGGYTRHNDLYRLVIDKQGQTTEEHITSNTAIMMYNPSLEANGGSAQ